MAEELSYTASIRQYIREGTMPSTFCPGCGHGILMGAILRAIYELGWDMDEMLFVSGIGCSGWIPSPYYNADTLHTPHGRAVAYACGAKAFNPKLKVVVIGGDGDLASIGTNHLIHAARRSTRMTAILANNGVYGMTGGHVTPTTPLGAFTITSLQGNPYRPLDLVKLMEGAGATYIARQTVYHTRPLVRILKNALTHEAGFSFVEVLSPCPTHYGRRNQRRSPWAMMEDYRDNCVSIEKANDMKPEELEGRIVVGEFLNLKSQGG